MSVKEQVLRAIERLPDDIDFRDVTDEIARLGAIHEAEQDIQQGRVISDEHMRSRIAEWSGSIPMSEDLTNEDFAALAAASFRALDEEKDSAGSACS